jgi:phosphatidate cytidylyltransferase
MLKQRIFTAIVLIPIILWILTLSSQTLAWVMAIFVLIGAWEWAGLSNLIRSIYSLLFGLSLFIIDYFWSYINIDYILYIACLWWLIALYWILAYQQNHNHLPTSPLIKAVLGFFILIPPWIALLSLHNEDRQWVIFLLVLIWSADIGAYFTGKKWGQTKLADKISPGKSWEGVAGALFISLLVALSYAIFNSMPLMTLLSFMLLCLITVIASIIGDLLESLFKRQVGMKDSSQILPGHGGVLDRIDSLTSAAPIFVLGLIIGKLL